ncbi:MAG: sel1 repeat family protein [Proteobacteria bacterium]|nr:sel1 repeat family protein [Pseudomonadota bacterium]
MSCALAAPAAAGFEEGRAAYNRQDWLHTILELRPLAETGDDRAMILLGNMYNEGYGVEPNPAKAFSLYWHAATDKNNPEAMDAVAAMYTSGEGIPQNYNAARQWFLRAAQLGDQRGAMFYAMIMYRGNKSDTDDVKPDFYASYTWFSIAAKETTDPKSQDMARALAAAIARKSLSAADVARADQEIAAWKPLDAAGLGPAPAEPKN